VILLREISVNFILNGKKYSINVPVNFTLLKVLRDILKLTGTKEGCGKGECGACTVIYNGRTENSCLILAPQIEGAEITTIEGIGTIEEPHIIQKAFVEEGAVQCGFCTPGFIVSAFNLLSRIPNPSEEEIREELSGNLCRCTGYIKIIKAVKKAAEEMSKSAD